MALLHIKEALRLDPDNRRARVVFKHVKRTLELVGEGRAAADARNFEAACSSYSRVLEGAERWLKRMLAQGVHASVISYNMVVNACAILDVPLQNG